VRIRRRFLSIPVFWMVSGLQGAAADARLPTEEDFFAPIPRVTSAARLEKSVLEMGASVTIIDRETIEASTALEIPDLLRLVPGFQVTYYNGASFAAAYHGAADQWPPRMEVMVDGRSVYLSAYAAIDWSALGLALEDVERIEVVRGPNAPTFGCNAVVGSINIVTRAPFLLQGAYLRGTVGSQGTGIGVGRLGARIGDWDTSLTIQYQEDDGFDDVDDHTRMTDVRLRGDYQASPEDTLSIQLGLSDGEVGADGQDQMFEPFRDRKVRSSYQQVTWNRRGPSGAGYRLNLYRQHYDSDDEFRVDASGVIPGAYLPLGWFTLSTERYDLELQQNLVPGEHWRLAWGLGGRYDKLSSELLLRSRGRVARSSGRLFGSAEWRPVEDIVLGLDFLTELHEGYGSETSPRLSVNWLASPSRSFRASASRSYHVFNLLGRYVDYPVIASDGTFFRQLVLSESGEDFSPERVSAVELGYTEDWLALGLLLDVRLFREELADAGVQVPRTDGVAYGRDRAGGWVTEGLEIQLDFRPTRDTRLVGAYTLARIDGETAQLLSADGAILEYESLDDTIPRHTLSLLLSQRFGAKWQGSLALFHMERTRWRGEGSEVDPYTRLDLKLARDFRVGDAQVQVSGLVQNLLDEAYDAFRVPGTYDRAGNVFDRRAYLQVSLAFD
jgi:iron complex outermembrane receptor protein